MSSVQESNFYRIWSFICALYGESMLSRALKAAGRWCNHQVDESGILRVLCREGIVARSWDTSLLCRGLTFLVNLPAVLLHRFYKTFQSAFDESAFAGFFFEIGEETSIAQSWLMMLLWIIPFASWDNAYNLMAYALVLAAFYLRGMHREQARLDVRAAGFYPVLLFCGICLAVVWSAYPGLSLRFLMYHVTCLICVLVTISAVRGETDLKRLISAPAFAVMMMSLYGVYQRIHGVRVIRAYVDTKLNQGMPGRVQSIFDNPNTFAEVLILLLPLILALIITSQHWVSKAAACGVFILGTAALGMTYSRASWIGMAVAMVVFVFLWKPALIPAFLALCVLCIPLLPSTIWNRILTITNTSDSSTASRIPLYQAALATIRKSPVSGAGLGTAAVQQYISEHNLYHAEAPFVHAHNIYLEVWIEAGIAGIFGFISAMFWNIKKAARTVRHSENSTARTIAAASAASLSGAMVCGLADYLWNYPRVMSIFWFVFAIAIVSIKLCRLKTEG